MNDLTPAPSALVTAESCDKRFGLLRWLIGAVILLMAGLVGMTGWAVVNGNNARTKAASAQAEQRAILASQSALQRSVDQMRRELREDLRDIRRQLGGWTPRGLTDE